ncbi:BhlA/UviB family holin-like peptide [Jeotgalibacillus proteolyticus]|uniref:BhlA/UviB family holin-like peptide n=1 Tax=Jeotgalibacillus proteolyticus TaxID=2082395 RepID=UPI003CF5FCFC
MESAFIEYLATQGIFAVLFGILFVYVLRTNKKREEEYKEIIRVQQENLPQIRDELRSLNGINS